MKKQDLTTGMRVRTRNGQLWLVLRNYRLGTHSHQDLMLASFGSVYLCGLLYEENLGRKDKDGGRYDIIEVYQPAADGRVLDETSLVLIWKREPSFNYKEFLAGKQVVNCRTKQDAELFLAFLTGKDLRWRSGHPPLSYGITGRSWNDYGGEVCFSSHAEGIGYSPMSHYKKEGAEIAAFDKEMFCN